MHGWILDIERTANNPNKASRSCCTSSSRSPRPAGRSAATTSRDHVLDNITLYWLANTAAPAARMYREADEAPLPRPAIRSLRSPAAFAVFPGEIF
jgi:hypothetical protein